MPAPEYEGLTPRQQEIQNLIENQDFQGAIDKAVELYDIDTYGVKPEYNSGVIDDVAVSYHLGGSYVNGVYVGGELYTLIGPKAFRSASELVFTLAHESVHAEQFRNGRWYESPTGKALREVEAYDRTISLKDELEAADELVEQDTAARNSWYDLLPPAIQQRVNSGNYLMPQ